MDEQEFDDFYAASYSRVVVQLCGMIGDRDEADECTQEAFARAWQHRGQLGKVTYPEAWVRTTAYRLAVSRWRKVVRGRRPPDPALSPALTAEPPSESHVAVVTALAKLPATQREAVVLHHIADLPIEAISRQLGAPIGTIKARLSRGRAALAALLADPDSQDARRLAPA